MCVRCASHISFFKCVQTLKTVENRHDEIGILPAFSPFKEKVHKVNIFVDNGFWWHIQLAITQAGHNINSFTKECVIVPTRISHQINYCIIYLDAIMGQT